MMDSNDGGQEELAPVAGLRDRFHQSRAALAERVPGGRESHPQTQIKGRLRLSDGERATLAGIAKRLGRKALQEIALHRQTGHDPRLVSEARRSEIRRLEETRIGRPPASRCDNRSAGGETGA